MAQSLCLLLVIKSGHCSLSGASLQIIMPNVKLQLVLIAIVIGLVTAKQSKDENNDSFGCEHQTVRSQKATIPFCGQPLFEDPKEPHRATSFIFRPAKSDDHSPNHFKCLGPEPLRKYCCLPNRIKDPSVVTVFASRNTPKKKASCALPGQRGSGVQLPGQPSHATAHQSLLRTVMQLPQFLLVASAIPITFIFAKEHKSQSEDSFDCKHQMVKDREASVAFCGNPIFGNPKHPKSPTSFDRFAPANPAGRSPILYYSCIGNEPIYKYCCLPGTIPEHSVTKPSIQEVDNSCVRYKTDQDEPSTQNSF
ncbi:hypothetical protein MJO29_014282 [Puccinia striiformis f. sp. tritici]|nr:hypothetical protein MJO29_014282 [Puccinia striiformis f. sp. tritici]